MSELKTETAKEIKEEAQDAVGDVIETAETVILRARKLARRGTLAYVGLFGMAFDAAAKRVGKLTEGREELVADLVKRGELLETRAVIAARDAGERVSKIYVEGAEKVRDIVPAPLKTAANDRVEDLEAEVEKLSRKIKAMNAKAAKATKTTTTKTTTKTTTPKKVAKKAA